MSTDRRIAVAMSGGVDSSVAAALLREQNEEIFGIMLRLWSGGPTGTNRCCSPKDMSRARQVAAQLDFPFYALDVQDRFKQLVVDFFIDGYAQGVTPNPCMECNRHIRWDFLLTRALAMGATHLATGHYARVRHSSDGYALHRARDANKDQSYVLSVLGQDQLAHAVFPLGDLTKDEVRARARELDLPVADRSESQDLCFVGGDYRAFLEHQGAQLPPPGPITNEAGEVLGQHSGLAFYTIGQRKGIRISAPQPLYVLEKDLEANRLVVGPREALGMTQFQVDRLNWIQATPASGFTADVQIRYRAPLATASVDILDGRRAAVSLTESMPDITPGQAAVFYRGDRCLGSGIIEG